MKPILLLVSLPPTDQLIGMLWAGTVVTVALIYAVAMWRNLR